MWISPDDGSLQVITHREQGHATRMSQTNEQMIRQRIFSAQTMRDENVRLKIPSAGEVGGSLC